MKSNAEKHEDIQQYELDALREIKEKMFEVDGGNERHSYFLKGIAVGLAIGIFGSIFVQFLYPIVEAILFGKALSAGLAVNSIVCAISIIAIVPVSIYLRRQRARDRNRLEISRKTKEVIDYAITRRQYALEQSKKE